MDEAAIEAALRGWAADGVEPEASFAIWLVIEATPDDWHRVVLDWNWDQGPEPLIWIITQPNCDRATALAVFWLSQPTYYIPFATDPSSLPDVNLEGFEILNLVRERWLAGRYPRAELAYDPCADFPVDFDALARAHGDLLDIAIPPSMRVKLPGREPTGEELLDGMPLRFWPEATG